MAMTKNGLRLRCRIGNQSRLCNSSIILALLSITLLLATINPNVEAFSSASSRSFRSVHHRLFIRETPTRRSQNRPTIPPSQNRNIQHLLRSSPSDDEFSSSSQYDISKPTFDLFSFRTVRGDALIQYSSTNQSEPLRINLYLLLACSLLSLPSASEAVLGSTMGSTTTILSILAGIASGGLFARECTKRNSQLIRIEREMDAERLDVGIPNRLGNVIPAKLKALRGQRRVLALMGTKMELREALLFARVMRRRLVQANSVIVAVPTDGSTKEDWGADGLTPWLAEAGDVPAWIEYFRGLTGEEEEEKEGDGTGIAWFGLNYNGRSFGSGKGSAPKLFELLGSFLRPVVVLDEDDESERTNVGSDGALRESVLLAQKRFYDALTRGNLEAMKNILKDEPAQEVSEVLNGGGRIDDWTACLADGARPEGMLVSGCDALISSPVEAYSTTVEFPANSGIDSATLLAVQKWGRDNPEDDEGWKLLLHQTIPWSPESKAGGTLRCDCRGCVALTRSPERRTFGGMIG